MTVHQFVSTLYATLREWIRLKELTQVLYAGGGAIHVVTKDGRKFRVLIEEE